jgi:YidC/Oxa1 family membrane protein insertase
MADSEQPKTPPKKPGEDMPMERRMLLAFALVGLVLFLSQYLFSPSAPSSTGPKQTEPATVKQATPPPPKPATAPAASDTPAAPIAADAEQSFIIDTDVFRVYFSNHGAVVRSWQLKNYKGSDGKPLELVNAGASGKTHFPFALLYENQKPSADLNQVKFAGTPTNGGLGVRFEYSDGRTSARKSFRFAQNSYLIEVVSEVKENNSGIPHMLAWRGGFGDRTAHAAGSLMRVFYYDLSQNKLIQNEAKAASDGPVTSAGTYSFAGMEDTYFAAAFLPPDRRSIKVQTLSDSVSISSGAGEEAIVGVGVGGDPYNQFSLFIGPKDLDLLRKVNPKLEQAVDFGWFAILARPLFLMLNWVNDNWAHNYGWAIIIVTIIINMALLPLKLSGMKGMKKMATLQPEIQAINKKYEGLSLRDPRKQQQNQEIMDLYKRHGVNPLGAGCMPLLLQIPFFFAFYKVLSVVIELRGAEWLWIRDLSQYDPWYLLPIVMVVTQFVLQKMTPQTTADPTQQRMMLFMPLMFGFLFIKAQAGLVLYWLTGNLVGIAQQWFINRMGPAPAVATVPQKTPAKKNVRK